MVAAMEGYSHILRILLNKGASVSKANGDGCTALHNSIVKGHLAATELLVEAGSDLNAVECLHSATPLHYAARRGGRETVRVLIEAGADVNSRLRNGGTPLLFAAIRGDLEVVRELLRGRTDALLSTYDAPHLVALDVAARECHSEVVRELIVQLGIEGCGGSSAGVHALENAAREGHLDITAMLTGAGVIDTGIALAEAIMCGHETLVRLLLQKHQQRKTTGGVVGYVNHALHSSGLTPLRLSMDSFHSSSTRIAQLLISAGADTMSPVRAPNPEGEVVCGDTPMAMINHLSITKEIEGLPATEDEMHILEAKRRLLLRSEAVRAVSWLWQRCAPLVGDALDSGSKTKMATTTRTALRTMLPILRRRARRRGALLTALFRWVMRN